MVLQIDLQFRRHDECNVSEGDKRFTALAGFKVERIIYHLSSKRWLKFRYFCCFFYFFNKVKQIIFLQLDPLKKNGQKKQQRKKEGGGQVL